MVLGFSGGEVPSPCKKFKKTPRGDAGIFFAP